MTICYAGVSRPTALRFQAEGLQIVRGNNGDVNWGRARANTSLNPDISNATNKRIMRELFQAHGVPAPELFPRLLTAPNNFSDSLVLDGPVVGRPDRHTGGRGFWLCYTVGDIRRAMRGTRRKKPATHFMEYINKSVAPREYRVHIFKGKSIRISEKAFGTTGLTSHGCYTTIKPTHDVSHVRRAAKQAVKAVGLDFGAVDILANDTECWVTEVNAAPGLGGTMPALYARAFRESV